MDGLTPLNICISTSGLASARVWVKLGYNFREILPDGRNNVFIVAGFGNEEVFDFLKNDLGMNLYCVKNDGITSLEWAFLKARFKAWAYLINEYHNLGVFEKDKSLITKNLEFLRLQGKQNP